MTQLELSTELRQLLADPAVKSTLVTVSPAGEAHATGDAELLWQDEAILVYREYTESSRAAQHLTYALWYDKGVSILVTLGGRHLVVRGVPFRAHVTGPLYQHEYALAQSRGADELASLWEIRITEIRDESPALLRDAERRQRPFFTHLDRVAHSV
ncbi:MAG: hypothetical protein QM784_04565 [Polyangiaceae bacterium]